MQQLQRTSEGDSSEGLDRPTGQHEEVLRAPAGVIEHESAHLEALATAATYSIQGATLEFRTAGGAIAAVLSRAG